MASIGWSSGPARKPVYPYQVHAHMLRHAAGYKLANAGKDTRSIQGYLGHKDIRHTVRYTERLPTRFKTSSRTDGKRNPEGTCSPGR